MNAKTRPTIKRIKLALEAPFREPTEGQLVDRFRLLAKIGHGKFGDVWRALDTSSSRDAAIKIFRPDRFEGEDVFAAAERFHDGAGAMRRLAGHPHVIPIWDGPHVDSGYVWFAMKYYPDGDLRRWSTSRQLSFSCKLGIARDVLAGLTHAHHNGVCHRDVRPENILIEDDGAGGVRAVLADFDIAYYEEELRTRNATTRVVGVPRYIPPDVVGTPQDKLTEVLRRPENDLFGLAVVLLDLLCGREVQVTSRTPALLKLLPRSGGEPCDLPSRAARGALAGFFSRALAAEAPERFRDVDEFRRTLESACGQSVAGRALLLAVVLTAGIDVALALDWNWPRLRGSVLIAIAARIGAALSVLGGATMVASSAIARIPPGWLRDATAFVSRIRALAISSLLLLLVVPVAYALNSEPLRRAVSAEIAGGKGCLLLDPTRQLVTRFERDEPVVFQAGTRDALICRQGSPALVESLSLIGLTPKVEQQERARFGGSSWQATGPTSFTMGTGKGRVNFALDAVVAFDAIQRDQQGLLHDGLRWALKRPLLVETSFGPSPESVDLWGGDVNIALRALELGALRVQSGIVPPPGFRDAETQARSGEAGYWADLAEQARMEAELKACNARCCNGTVCERHGSCEEIWKCKLCNSPAMRWRVRLDSIAIQQAAGWKDTKVCLDAGSRCNSVCVGTRDAGSALGTFDCDYSSKELLGASVRAVGSRSGVGPERVAQKAMSLVVHPKSICSGFSFGPLDAKNGAVSNIRLSLLPAQTATR